MNVFRRRFFKAIDLIPAPVYVINKKKELKLPPHAHKKDQFIFIDEGIGAEASSFITSSEFIMDGGVSL